MDLSILADPRLHELLLLIDQDLAEAVRAGGCPCGGRLHRADYQRKPRGMAVEPGRVYARRLSWCCGACRRRRTPPSVRFFGRRVYLAAVVVVVSALAQGLTQSRMEWLRQRVGVGLRTVGRWRAWWREVFVATRFWKAARALIQPPVDTERLPVSLLERFAGGDPVARLGRVLRFVSPLTTSSA